MTRFRAGVALAWLVACVSLVAADFWESKPSSEWSAKELQQMLTDSPWAGKASIKYVRSNPNQQAIQETAIVTWASAPIMRQALAREEAGAGAEVSKEGQSVIARTPQYYIVTVKVSNGVNSGDHANHTMEMLDETFLVVRDRPPIPALQVDGQVLDANNKTQQPGAGSSAPRGGGGVSPSLGLVPDQRGGGGGGSRGGSGPGPNSPIGGRGMRGPYGGERSTASSLIVVRFPRDPIAVEDKQVEFVTKLCGGGFRAGAPASQPANRDMKFEVGAGVQRGGGGGAGGGVNGTGAGGMRGGNNGSGRMARPADLPTCNQEVKKTFKLKDMAIKGELAL
jgi:hypothetical protein